MSKSKPKPSIPRVITVAMLRKMGACNEAVQWFTSNFGDRARFSARNLSTACATPVGRQYIGWLTLNILGRERFLARRERLWKWLKKEFGTDEPEITAEHAPKVGSYLESLFKPYVRPARRRAKV